MKIVSLVVVLLFNSLVSFGQTEFYSKAYGDNKNKAIIFLHGGPGYNSVSFEFSTAQRLADQGYYVIMFDQRGCGRTKTGTKSLYTFKEAFEDVNGIYDKYNLKTASLVGHSFGGTVAILFSKNFPGKVDNLILVGSPVSYQLTFKTIIAKCKEIYTRTNSSQLEYIEKLEKIDTASLEYSSYCFAHAMNNGFYNSKNPTDEAKMIKDSLKRIEAVSYLSNMTRAPVSGFYTNEHYTTLDLSDDLLELQKKVRLFGIYGKEDGLFDNNHITVLESIIGANHFTFVDGASHSVFTDQQTLFIQLVKNNIEKKK